GGPAFDSLRHLLYSYGMASHQVHQDADAIGMVWERARREPERHEAVQLAHGCRELTDLLVMAMARCLTLHRALGADRRPLKGLLDRHQGLLAEMHPTHEVWHQVEYGAGAAPGG